MPDETIEVHAQDPQYETTPAPLPNTLPEQASSVMASPAPAPAPQANPAAVAQIQHDSKWGRLAKTLLGANNNYTIDPKTGQTVASPIEAKPGDIWRHIVAGAMLGGAAAEEKKARGFLGGVSVGGSAAHEEDLRQDAERRKNAQTQFNNQQERERMGMEQERLGLEKSRLQQEGIFQQAQVAHWTATSLRADRELELQSEEFVQRQNEFNVNLQLKLGEQGAQEIPIPAGPNGENINGQMDNGAAIQKYMTDPNNRKAPAGFIRLPIMTVDTNGLHRDPKTNQWLDADNKPTSLNDRATWHVYQIPQNTMSQPTEVKGSQINKMTGSDLPPNATYRMPLSDYIGLATKAKQQGLEEQRTARQERHDAVQAQYEQAKIAHDDANRELTQATAAGDQAGIDSAKQKMTDAEEDMQTAADQLADLVKPGSSTARKEAKEKAEQERKAALAPEKLQAKAPWDKIPAGKSAVFDQKGNFKGMADPGKAPAGMIEVPRPGTTGPTVPPGQQQSLVSKYFSPSNAPKTYTPSDTESLGSPTP